MNNLLSELEKSIGNLKQLSGYVKLSDNDIMNAVVKSLYDNTNGNIMMAFLELDKIQKEANQKEYMRLYGGLEDAMHNFSRLAKCLDFKEFKQKYNLMFKDDGNIAYLIRIAKAYFPKGNSDGASANGKWFFEQFKKLLLENKDQYVEGGSSYSWAETHNYTDYINLILKNS